MTLNPLQIQRLLIPVDFSNSSRRAFYTGIRFSRIFDAETHILHVPDSISALDSSFDKVEAVAEELARLETGVRRRINELFDKGGIAEVDRRKVKVSILGGKPHAEIVKFACSNDVDLIVMGADGGSGVKARVMGTVTERVVRDSPCPVLCVKPEDFVSPFMHQE
ncbi:MAG: hypothetical protein CMH54_13525 [Myxococcales bacterium]|nr:hypothetical protein [Myxococcales bacterium]|tara:strand:+ start:509 stop:1003 length:495 start_codon:yes stop_codon:yes gene_type:complete